MKRRWVLFEIVIRHPFGVSKAGALLGAIYGFLALTLASITRAIISPVPHPDFEEFTISVMQVLYYGILVAIIGGIFGAILGLVVGLVNGLLLGPLTVLAFYPPARRGNYRLVTGLISAIAAIATTYIIFVFGSPSTLGTANSQEPGSMLLQLLLSPVPIAGFGAWWASRKVARWYQHELPAQQAQAASPSSPGLL
jgi:hypothetical protein